MSHRIADARGLPCYVGTFTEPNVPFYGRRGYEVVGEYEVGQGIPVFALVRHP
jgi:hypothetical protein